MACRYSPALPTLYSVDLLYFTMQTAHLSITSLVGLDGTPDYKLQITSLNNKQVLILDVKDYCAAW